LKKKRAPKKIRRKGERPHGTIRKDKRKFTGEEWPSCPMGKGKKKKRRGVVLTDQKAGKKEKRNELILSLSETGGGREKRGYRKVSTYRQKKDRMDERA